MARWVLCWPAVSHPRPLTAADRTQLSCSRVGLLMAWLPIITRDCYLEASTDFLFSTQPWLRRVPPREGLSSQRRTWQHSHLHSRLGLLYNEAVFMPVRTATAVSGQLCPTHDFIPQTPVTLQSHCTARFLCPTRVTLIYYSLKCMGQFVNKTSGGFQHRFSLKPTCLFYSLI